MVYSCPSLMESNPSVQKYTVVFLLLLFRRKKSLLSPTDRTSSWRRPDPGSVMKTKTKSDKRA